MIDLYYVDYLDIYIPRMHSIPRPRFMSAKYVLEVVDAASLHKMLAAPLRWHGSHLHKEFKMNVLEIGRVSAETKTNSQAILSDGAKQSSFSPKRYCFDNSSGGTNQCQEVFDVGKHAVSPYTTADDCFSSPNNRTNCF
jgi:hypothetical protein